jgi:hypothetical protein
LVSGSGGMSCDRLPFALTVCPVCSHGFKQSRGFTWVDVAGLVEGVHKDCADQFPCPFCTATATMGKAGMIWIGEKFYPTPASFDREVAEMGVSRRIHVIPRNFKLGETWILLAHPKGISEACADCGGSGLAKENGVVLMERCGTCEGKLKKTTPAIFKVWKPERIEMLLPESKRDSEQHADLEKRGITIIFVPDDDPDHQGSVYDDEDADGAE